MNVKLIATTAAILSSLPVTTFASSIYKMGGVSETLEIAQQGQITIKGVVQDEDGKAIIGASVSVLGNPQKGVITDNDGQFTLRCKPTDTLVFSSIGYQKTQEALKGRTVLAVTLKEAAKEIDEVVVTAFGATQKKETVVGSIQQVAPESLRVPGSNISTAFAGRLAGVMATQSSGQPGANGANFYIRGISTISGATSPLIIMDGMEISQDDLNHLDPDVIESFSILKDASATAMYGTRGANGVLIITTKSGRDQEKPTISFRFEGNITTPTSVPKFVDGPRYMQLYNEGVQNQGTGDILYTQTQIDGTRNNLNPYVYPNVDWYNELFKKSAFNQKANMNIRGGTKKIVYFMNLNVSRETGMLKERSKEYFSYGNNINLTRYAFQNNIDFHMSKSSTISLHLYAALDDKSGPAGDDINSIFQQVMAANPVQYPITYPNDDNSKWAHWGFSNLGNSAYTNPMAKLTSGYSNSFASTITANINFDQKLDFLTKGLAFHLMFSFKNWSYTYVNRVQSAINLYELKSWSQDADGNYILNAPAVGDPTKPTLGTASSTTGDRRYYAQAYLDYNRTFGNHTVSAMLLWNVNQYNVNNPGNNLINTLPQRKVGFAAKLSYDYLHKYLIEFNAGYNGSENFAPGHRWGFFPSIGAGYVISEEKFWEPIKNTVSMFKVRGTYGLVGNDQYGGERFIYREDVSLTGNGSFTTGVPGSYVSASGPGWNRLRNYNITWEVGHKLDIGFDLELFRSLTVTFDWFRERRSNIFQQKYSIPDYFGTVNTKIYGNLGEVVNKGVDMSVSYAKNFGKDWSVQFQGTFTWNRNKITKFDEAAGKRPALMSVGKSTNVVWGYIADGLYIDQADIENNPSSTLGNIAIAPGDIKYVDQPDGDGKYDGQITSDDRVPIGLSQPEIIYGFGPSIRYKNWDFSVFFQGRAKVDLFLSGFAPFGTQYNRNVLQFIDDDHWSPTNQNPNAAYPRLTKNDNNNNNQTSTYWRRDGSFLKLKNAEIGYSYRKFRVYVNATNLLTFAPFKLWDPEMGSGSYVTKYPTQRTINVGIQLTIN